MDIQKEIIFPQIKMFYKELEEKLEEYTKMGIALEDIVLYWNKPIMEKNIMKFSVTIELKRKNGL